MQIPTSIKWRSEAQQRHLASQVGSLLLQRSDPISLLRSNPHLLPSPLPTPFFSRILTRIRSQPETSLHFFNFARSDLSFKPDVHSISILTHSLIESKLQNELKNILEPILRSEPVKIVLDSMIRTASNGEDSRPRILSFLLRNYSFLRLIDSSLETLAKIRFLGFVPSTSSVNELLNALSSSNLFEVARTCHAILIRIGFESDEQTWSAMFRIVCSQGKLNTAEKLLHLGFCDVSSYGLIVDCYCKRGDFKGAIQVLNRMYEKKLTASSKIYACFVDGGCKFGDAGVTRLMLKEMIVRGLLRVVPILDYDRIINWFCELDKAYAAEMFFSRARNANFKLGKGAYANVLSVLAKEGRTRKAMDVYCIMLQEGVAMNHSCSDVFLRGLCKGEPLKEAYAVLKDLIGKGFAADADVLSRQVTARRDEGRWDEAHGVLNIALDKGMLLDASCCRSLVKHYCANGLVDSATELHEKMKKCGGCLDAVSYNVLLEALFCEGRIEDAIRVFEDMQCKSVANSASFVMMIKALCREKEMRRAMKVHDEMLKLGLMPDDATYRRLISGFA